MLTDVLKHHPGLVFVLESVMETELHADYVKGFVALLRGKDIVQGVLRNRLMRCLILLVIA